MKRFFKNANIRKTAAAFLSFMLLAAILPLIPVNGAVTAIPVYVDLNTFSDSNVGGDSAATLLWKKGNANTSSGVLRVVPASGNQAGTVVRRSKIKLSGGFSTYFVMNLNGSGELADGLVFVVQNNSAPQVGKYGAGLGYDTVGNSIGVEFDLFKNNSSTFKDDSTGKYYYDPSAGHVAIVKNGDNTHTSGNGDVIDSSPGTISNQDINVWIDYDTSGTLTATYGTDTTKGGSNNRSISRDVGADLKDKEVYVGFCASTGGSKANHDIKKWFFSDKYVSGGLSSDASNYTQGASGVDISLNKTINPTSATVKVLDAGGAAMTDGEKAEIYLDDVDKGQVTTDTSSPYTASYTISSGSLTDGAHTVKAVAASGGATDSVTFTVDNTVPNTPSITFKNGYTAGTWSSGSVTFTAGTSTDGTSGIDYYQYSTDNGSSWTNYTSATDVTLSTAGTYTVSCRAYDKAGNYSTSTSYTVKIDKTASSAPSVSFTSPSGYSSGTWTASSVSFSVSGGADAESSINHYEYSTDGGGTWSTGNSGTISTAGTYTLLARAVNGAGTNSANSTAATVRIDKTAPAAPTVSFMGPSGYTSGAWTNGTVSFEAAGGSDGESGVSSYEYSTDGGSTWSAGSSGSVSDAGTYSIAARAKNGVGLTSGSSSAITAKIDKTAPSGSLSLAATYGGTSYTRNQAVNLTISGSDTGGSGVSKMEIGNSSDFSSSSGWIAYGTSYSNWTLSEGNGTKTVYLRFQDAAGNISATATDTIVFDNTPPTVTISEPSRFSAKKGMTISYTLTLNGADTLTGINAGSTAKIDLQGFGGISASISAIKAGITVQNTDATHRKVNIPLPSDLSSEGTVGLKVLSGAASDNAGNLSAETLANFSFLVDGQAPDYQDSVFTTDAVIKGGQPVALDMTCVDAGGLESDSVRFAPAGYDGTAPANGTTITVTHGASETINAPATPGIYYIYIIDAAGNISQPSAAKLTVKNDGPAVTVSGPSQAYVQAKSTVSYTVTYSSDTSSITLSQQDVALVTTGTANAYVAVGTIEGQPLQRKVTLSNLMGEGTIRIRIAAGTAADAIGNPAAASAISDPVKVDNTAATLDLVTLVSNNSNPEKAKKGDTLTLSFTAGEPIQIPAVSIAGQTVTAINGSGDRTHWQAQYTVPTGSASDSLNGKKVAFSIITADLAGNGSNALTAVTSGAGVEFEFTAPAVILSGTQDGSGIYTGPVTVTFDKGTAVLRKDGSVIDPDLPSGSSISQQGSYSVTVTDSAGNSTTKTFVYSQAYSEMTGDKAGLSIGYAYGDSADSVTRNVTLPLHGANGSDVAWQSSDPAHISTTGEVQRPTDGDKTVTLTATLTKGGYSDAKTFTLTVKKQPAAGDEAAKAQEDADGAYILYGGSDNAQSVTQAIRLAATGLFWNSTVTWTTSDDSIRISQPASGNVYGTVVTRPPFADGDKTVTLTATTQSGTSTARKDFTLLVKRLAGTDAQEIREDADTVSVVYAPGDSANHVTQNVTLYSELANGSSAVWSSSDPACVSNSGQVSRPVTGKGDRIVTISVRLSNGQETFTKSFTLRVLEADRNDQISSDLAADRDSLEIGYRNGDTTDRVTTHVILPVSTTTASVSWASSDSSRVDASGTVIRPASGSGDKQVTLTATLTKNGQTAAKIFQLTVKQQPQSLLDQISEDFDSAEIFYASGDSAKYVTRNVGLATEGPNGSAIIWTSSLPSVVSAAGSVSRQGTDEEVALTATISKGGFSKAKTFHIKVIGTGQVTLSTDYERLSVRYADGDSADSVTRAVYLAKTGATGTTITWSSSRPDLVAATGRVTRPGPEDADRWVILTAVLTNLQNGQSMTRTFEVKVKKLSDTEAVQTVAKALTSEVAFDFNSTGDTWESVTQPFLILTAVDYDTVLSRTTGASLNWTTGASLGWTTATALSWVSDKPEVIRIGSDTDANGKLTAFITRQTADARVILTATITYNGANTLKTFLMIVKGAAVSKTPDGTRQPTNRVAEGATPGTSQSFDILRTILSNGEKVDTVILDPAKMQSLTDDIDPMGDADKRTVTVTMSQDGSAPADQLAVEIPSTAVAAMADWNAGLYLRTDEGSIRVEADTLSEMADRGADLYFRIVPVEDSAEQASARAAAAANGAVVSLVGGGSLDILGIPRTIETNYSNFETYVILPLTGITVPASGQQEFLDSLRIFVEHSDGAAELLTPARIVYDNGIPAGVEFKISKFSRFQIIRTYAGSSSEGSNGSGGGSSAATATGTPAASSGDSVTIKIDTSKNGETAGDYGRTTVSGMDGEKTVDIRLDDSKVQDALDKDPGKKTLTVAITPENAHEMNLTLSGSMLAALERRGGSITLENGSLSLSLGAGSIGSVYLGQQFPGVDLEKVNVRIHLTTVGTKDMPGLPKALAKEGVSLIGTPMEFGITATDGSRTVTLSPFNGYSQLDIAIPQGQDGSKITTAVRYLENGGLLHIPTRIIVKDNRYYARINNLEGGIFTLIWHPLSFADAAGHWAKASADNMGSRLVISGTGNGLFQPDREITRAEFAAAVVRALGLKPGQGSNPFADVNASEWYCDWIKTAVQYKLISGYGNGKFGPDDRITRQQAAAMAARAMKLAGLKAGLADGEAGKLLAGFEDSAQTASWAKDSLAACVKTGILAGKSGKLLAPGDEITRAEVAVMLERLLKKSGLI
jgi:hypothetical protein